MTHSLPTSYNRRESIRSEGVIYVTEIYIGDNEPFEAALRRFNKKVQQDGVLAEARRREHYEKPSVKRKKKEATKRRKTARSASGTARSSKGS